MSTIIGSFPVTDSAMKTNQLFIQQNDQNHLKGLVWAAVASTLTTGTLAFTGVAIGAAITNSVLSLFAPRMIPILILGSAAVAGIDYALIKVTGNCFNNALHHLGPEYQIVKR
jgi:hypothetical protein